MLLLKFFYKTLHDSRINTIYSVQSKIKIKIKNAYNKTTLKLTNLNTLAEVCKKLAGSTLLLAEETVQTQSRDAAKGQMKMHN